MCSLCACGCVLACSECVCIFVSLCSSLVYYLECGLGLRSCFALSGEVQLGV